MPRTGECRECGAEFIRMNKRRELCTECQILRDHEYRPGASKTCGQCGRVHWPVRLSYKTCNDCREYMERPGKYPPCTKCKRCFRPAPGGVAYCMSCVQGDPLMKMKYINSLKKVVAARAKQWYAAKQGVEL